jgi:hypothetical protein
VSGETPSEWVPSASGTGPSSMQRCEAIDLGTVWGLILAPRLHALVDLLFQPSLNAVRQRFGRPSQRGDLVAVAGGFRVSSA